MVEVAGRYQNPPAPLEALLSHLSTWVRLDRTTPRDHVPVMLEQRLGRAAIDELVAAYRGGATKHELAKRYKIGRTSVYDLLMRYKIERRPR